MWSRKSHHEDIRKLQWCSCRCCTNDPVLKLQMNGSREKQCKPKLNTDSKNSDGKKSCVLCKDSVTSPQVTMKFVNSVASREEKITHRDNNSNHQNAVDIECDKESSKYDDDFDQRAVSIYYFNNHESRVFECLLHWQFIQTLISLNTVQYIYHFNTYNNDTTRRVSSTGLFSHLHHEVIATDCPFRQYLGSER